MKVCLLGLSAATLFFSAKVFSDIGVSANTTLPDVDQVASDHQIAVCRQDWTEAERQASILMALPSVTPELRQDLVDLRRQYVLYAADQTQFDSVPGCEGVTLPIESANSEDEPPLAPLGGETFDSFPPPLSALEAESGSGIPTPPSNDVIVITGDTSAPLTIANVYHRGSVVYGTIVNNTGQAYRDIQILASLYDSGAGFAHSAQYTYRGAINPGARVEIPVTIQGTGYYSEPGYILTNPQFEIWATGF